MRHCRISTGNPIKC